MNGRQLLVMDPSKLGLFNRAAAVRAGAATGAFGAADGGMPWATDGGMPWTAPATPAANSTPAYQGPGAAGGWKSDTAVAYSTEGEFNPNLSAREMGADNWLGEINKLFAASPEGRRATTAAFTSSPAPMLLLGGAVLVGGVVLYMLLRK